MVIFFKDSNKFEKGQTQRKRRRGGGKKKQIKPGEGDNVNKEEELD